MSTYEQLVKNAKKNADATGIKLPERQAEYLAKFAQISAKHEAKGIDAPVNPIVAQELGLTRQRSNVIHTYLRVKGMIEPEGRRLTKLGKSMIDKKTRK